MGRVGFAVVNWGGLAKTAELEGATSWVGLEEADRRWKEPAE